MERDLFLFLFSRHHLRKFCNSMFYQTHPIMSWNMAKQIWVAERLPKYGKRMCPFLSKPKISGAASIIGNHQQCTILSTQPSYAVLGTCPINALHGQKAMDASNHIPEAQHHLVLNFTLHVIFPLLRNGSERT